MHIAVFDDNIADRKQLERLLGRQSDRYQKEGKEHFYIDSYGNMEALMRLPQMYDVIFIDMVEPAGENSHFKNGLDVAKLLFEEGGIKNIVMCSSRFDYEKMAEEAGIHDKMFYLKKDIRVKDLEEVLAECENRLIDPIKRLEIRGEKETVYAEEEDIICATKSSMFNITVSLTDNRQIVLMTDIYNFYEQCEIFTAMCPVSQNAMINVLHIAKEKFGYVVMDNGEKIRVAFSFRDNINEIKRRLLEEGRL